MIFTSIMIVMAIALSLAMSFFFSGSETAVISANQYRLRHLFEEGDAQAGRTLAMLSRPSELMSAVLIGTNLGNVLAVLFFKLLLNRLWEGSRQPVMGLLRWDELISIVVLTTLIVVCAEILPKAIFRARADAWIGPLRGALVFSMTVLSLPIKILDAIVGLFFIPLGGRNAAKKAHLTRGDLVTMISTPPRVAPPEAAGEPREAASSGDSEPLAEEIAPEGADAAESLREPDQHRLIQNIIELEQSDARQIMRPLVELEAVRLDGTTIESFLEVARRSSHSRFPVFRDRIVNLIGYINVYDVIRDTRGRRRLEDFVRPSHFVPETKRADDLLQEMLLLRINNAIVVDEHGGASGWIAREDIIEEIVGELEDELDEPTIFIEENADGSFAIDGRIQVGDLDEVLGTHLEDADCDTLGGVLMKQMGRIPKVGESIALGDWRMRVTETDGMRVARVTAERVSKD